MLQIGNFEFAIVVCQVLQLLHDHEGFFIKFQSIPFRLQSHRSCRRNLGLKQFTYELIITT